MAYIIAGDTARCNGNVIAIFVAIVVAIVVGPHRCRYPCRNRCRQRSRQRLRQRLRQRSTDPAACSARPFGRALLDCTRRPYSSAGLALSVYEYGRRVRATSGRTSVLASRESGIGKRDGLRLNRCPDPCPDRRRPRRRPPARLSGRWKYLSRTRTRTRTITRIRHRTYDPEC
jgi:hypothetical protein